MHNLSNTPFERDATVDWSDAAISARAVSGFRCFHVKVIGRDAGIGAQLDLPAAGFQRDGVIGVAPGEWLVLVPEDADTGHDPLAVVRSHPACWTVEIGDGLVILDLALPDVEAAELTGLPLSAFAPGRAVRTRVADIAMILVGGEDGTLRAVFDRSYDRHIRAWLDKAR